MQKPPMVHSAGTQNVANLQQQITQQPAALNSGRPMQKWTPVFNFEITNKNIQILNFVHTGSSQQTLTPAQAAQQQLRLQRLQQEQDRLRQRQQEIIAMVF